jgi:hypothetical protein
MLRNLLHFGDETAGDLPRLLGLVDGFLDFLAERLLAVLTPDQRTHSAP